MMIGTRDIAPQLAADVATVAVGQGEIEQHDIRLFCLLRRGRSAYAGREGAIVVSKAVAVERVRERLGDRGLVLDKQNGPGPTALRPRAIV